MQLQWSVKKHMLRFRFDAGTSRGVFREKACWYLMLCEKDRPEVIGVGEIAPLKGFSLDYREDYEAVLPAILNRPALQLPATGEAALELAASLVPPAMPALVFALETALLDLLNGGKRRLFAEVEPSAIKIPINGLVWMGDPAFMQQQIEEKLAAGFTCIKMKIGALDFEEECRILRNLRQQNPSIAIRLDANGAFSPGDAAGKLERLAAYGIDSLEQPVAAGQPALMASLCATSPVDIALDEELNGIWAKDEKDRLLDRLQPQALILKPSLLGGIRACDDWITLAGERGIRWWFTSALESNVGLNAIAQNTARYAPQTWQGLGTGQLFHNNIPSPLFTGNGQLQYGREDWSLSSALS